MKAKLFFSILLMITLLFSICTTVDAYYEVTSGTCGAQGDNLTWQFTAATGTLTISGQGAMADYPNEGPWNSEWGRKNIMHIEVKEGVTTIGDRAFYNSRGVTVSLPEGLISIGSSAFEGCEMSQINLPSTLETIESYAFVSCHFSTITIPANVSSLHYRSFSNNIELKSINVDPDNQWYCSSDGVLFTKDMSTLIKYPSAKSESSYTIPNGVETIANMAFHLVGFSNGLTIPKSVKTIEELTFLNGQINIPNVYYGGTKADRQKMSIGDGNDVLTNATWHYTAPVFACSFTDSTATKGESATVSLVIDTDITVLAGTMTVSAKNSNGNELEIIEIQPSNIAGCTIDYEGNKILVATQGTIEAGTKIADITFATDSNTVAGTYDVTLVSDLYTGDMDSSNNDQKLEIDVNKGSVIVNEIPVTVTWENYDGSILETDENVAYNSVPTYDGTTPQKASTDQYDYTFNGWFPTVDKVTTNTTYTATFTETLRYYTLTFKDQYGVIIVKLTVPYGTEVKDIEDIPEVPAKNSTDEYTYTPNDWGVQTVTGDATYTASYTATKNSYTITWLDDIGEKIDTTTVEYGEIPTHVAPTKASSVGYTYTFDKWSPELSKVTGDAIYTASYIETARTYNVSVEGVTDGSTFVIKTAEGDEVQPNNGVYVLTYNQTYTYTRTAVGFETTEGSFTVRSDNDCLSFDSDAGTATITLSAMKKFIGDINCDGVITILDAQALYNYILDRYEPNEDGLTYNSDGELVFNLNVADVNNNGTVGSDDILPMLRLINQTSA